MTATRRRPLRDYGPVQIQERLRLATWQLERAMAAGLLARPGESGRWPAAVVDDALARREEILTAVGAVPDLGAGRAAELLATRFRLDIDDIPSGVLIELDRRGLVPRVGGYRGNPIYCGRALEAFGDRVALDDALRDGRLLMTDQVVDYLAVRRCDVDQLVTLGWLVPVTWVLSRWQRRGESRQVALYRVGDLDVLLNHPAIDWDAVRSTPYGRRSPLAKLGPWARS